MKRYYIIVTPFFPTPDSFRGAFVYDQVKAIQSLRDYEIVVLKPKPLRDHTEYYEYEGFKIYLYPVIESPSYLFNGIFNEFNARSFVRTLLNAGIEPDKIAAVHCHTSSFGECGLELKKRNNEIKVLLQHHDKDPFTILNGKLACWKPNTIYRAKKNIAIFNSVDCHVCISEACRANLICFPGASEKETYQPYMNRLENVTRLPSIQPKETVVLYNGVDLSKFYNKHVKDKETFNVGCVANFIPLKGQEELIKAFSIFIKKTKAENATLKLLGSGPTKEGCMSLCIKLGIGDNVDFCKEIGHNELVEFYNTLDLIILPSHFDGFGCVCLEAFACGVPFMISENQGAYEYIDSKEKNLWTFKPGDIETIAKRIEQFYFSRTVQKLKFTIDIKRLVEAFLKKVGL